MESEETERGGTGRKLGGAALLVALLVGIPLLISGLGAGPSGGGVVQLLAGVALVGAAVGVLVRERR